MHTSLIFFDLMIIFLVSVPVAFVCIRLKLPVLVGFMLTGIAIGPYGFGLIKELEAIEVLAEIGVMLLLFTIGIEFSIERLRKMRNLVAIGGGLQVLITIGLTALLATALGRQLNQAIFFGFLVALSSTAIVLKTYADRREIDSPHGRAGVGILLFQDISIVFMMLFVPILGGTEVVSAASIATRIGGSLLALILIVLAARVIIPKLLQLTVSLRSPEVLILTAALISFGTAWVTAQFGLSLALGAFIAGVILSESEYSHQITAEILPFRDVFNSIFFVSIGLLLSLASLIENLGTVLLWVVLLLIGKAVIITLVVKLLKYPLRIGVMTGLGLAQIGEFSFVLAKAGRGTDLLPAADYQVFLAASIISMFATPFLISIAPRFGYLVQQLSPKGSADLESFEGDEIHLTASGGLANHVIIVGYGLAGRNLAKVLRTVHVPYTILDLNGEVVRRARARGEKINFGDSTRASLLVGAGIDNANALVLAISDPHAARRTVRQARALNPELYIVARTRYNSDISDLMELGANEVVPEEFESSIEIFARVLQRYGVARHVIEKQIDGIRSKGYEMLRSTSLPQDTGISDLDTALRMATTETIRLKRESPAIGKSLAELNLRGVTGVSVIAVIQDSETIVNPGAEFRLRKDDILAVLGESEKIEKTFRLLQPPDKSPKIVLEQLNPEQE